MLLVDLVLQGVRKFVQSQKIPFKPGFNLVYGGNESGKTTLYECILELMFPNRIVEEKAVWQSWKGADQSRAGLTFQKNGQLYRVLKDFIQNRISLSRKAPAAEKFERLSSEPSEIASILAEEFGLIGWEDYRTLFLESRLYLPSHTGIGKAEKTAGRDQVFLGEPGAFGANPAGQQFGGGFYPGMSPEPGFGSMPGMAPPGIYPGIPGMGIPGLGMPGAEMLGQDDGMNWEEKEKKLEKLKSELVRIKEMEEIQFEMDGLQSKVFELSREKDKIKKIEDEVKKLDEELDKYRFFRNLPENLEQRITQYDSLQENKGKDLDALDQKLADKDDEIRYLEFMPKFHQVNLFKAGMGVMGAGILGVILGSILSAGVLQALQPFFGVVIVAGIVMALIPVWKFFVNSNKIAELRAAVKKLEDQRRTTAKDYEVKGAIVKRLLDQTRCDHTDELKEMYDTFKALDTKKNELSRKKKELIIELDLDRLNKEDLELQGKISALEQKLKGFAALGMDPNEVRREIERLEQTLNRARQLGLIAARPQPAAQAGPAATRPKADAGSTQMLDAVKRSQMPFWERVLESAGRILGFKTDDLLGQISAKANLYLQALSAKKYESLRKESGKLLVRVGEMNQEIELPELGGPGFDIVYFSLKFAILELLSQKFQFPLILDDPYLYLDESRLAAVAKTLKRLSQKAQIIAFSSQKIFVREADNALSLG